MDGSPSKLRSAFVLAVVSSLCLLFSVGGSEGQTTSITSSGLGTTISPPSIDPAGRPNYIITGGTRPGNGPNLFHSFGDFSVGTNNVARFFNETGRATTNILSRVTGGQTSNIYGTIQTAGFGTAALWLINPAGIVFGPTASLNVGGSAHFSTADYLRMSDGAQFFASLAKQSTLSSAPVTAFGFLGQNPSGTIAVQGGTVVGGQTLSLVGRDLTVNGTTTPGIVVSGGQLSNPSGRINLVSVGAPVDRSNPNVGGEVVFSGAGPSAALTPTGFSSLGTIRIANGAVIANGNPGGLVYIRGGSLMLDASTGNSFISSRTEGAIDHPGIGVDIEVAGEIRLTAGTGGAEITSSSGVFDSTGKLQPSERTGNAGDMRIVADTLHLTGNAALDLNADIGSRTFSSAIGAGHAGRVNISAQRLILDENAFIQVSTYGPGAGGTLNVTTNSLEMNGALGTRTFLGADTFGDGSAGAVNLNANSIVLIGGNPGFTGISSGVDVPGTTDQFGTFQGNPSAGPITINTGSLQILNGAQISASLDRGSGQGGSIQVNADSIFISGRQQGGFVSGIFASTEQPTSIPAGYPAIPANTGRGGDIQVSANSIALTNFGEINAASFRAGATGNISITTDTLHMNAGATALDLNPSRISINTSSTNSAADAGTLTIKANTSIDLRNGASITGGSLANLPRFTALPVMPAGDAGMITITTPNLSMFGSQTNIASLTEGSGNAGSINMNINQLTMTEGGQVSSRSIGSTSAGSAGQILIRGQNGKGSLAQSVALDDSTISTTIDGGTGTSTPATIDIAAQSVTLVNASTVNAATRGTAPAGNIVINAATLSMNPKKVGGEVHRSEIIASTIGSGKAGDITIDATDKVIVSGSVIESASFQAGTGPAGKVKVTTPILTVEEGGWITTSTLGSGAGGSLELNVGNLVIRNSQSGNPLCCGVTSDTSGSGDAGSITMNVDQLTMTEHGRISSNSISVDTSAGSAGQIVIRGQSGEGDLARSVNLDNSSITTTVSGGTSISPPATIVVSAQNVSLQNGSQITADTNGAAHAGDIIANAGRTMILGNGANISSSSTAALSAVSSPGNAGSVALTSGGQFQSNGGTISSSAGDGQGGIIKIQGGNLVLDNGTTVTASTTGLKNAGDINLISGDSISIANSMVTTSAADASGGNITLTAPNMVRLAGAKLLSDVHRSGNGGNITIDPRYVIIQGGSEINASAPIGEGGKINITASQAILQEAGTTIKATGGNPSLDGQINIQAPIQQLAGAIAPLPQAFAVATNLYGQRCATQKGGQFSSFVQGARDGVPPQPGDLIQSPLLEIDGASPSLGSQSSPSFAAIRLGLPEFDHPSPVTFMSFVGCRS